MKTLFKILFFFLISQGIILPQLVTQNHSKGKYNLGKTSVAYPNSSELSSIGIRAGLGTDINLGLAYGGGINYLFNLNQNAVELGIVVFGGHSEETSVEYNTYTEKTDVLVYGVLANYLFGYELKKAGLFGLIGLGFCAIIHNYSPNSIN